jgi:hypothetical protein
VPANLLLLPLLGGFWILKRFNPFRYRSRFLDGYALLLESAFIGMFLFAIARTMIVGIVFLPYGDTLRTVWGAFAPTPYLGTATVAFVLGVLGPSLGNRIVKQDVWRKRSVERYSNQLIRLLTHCAESEAMVSITLATRKWYAGYVIEVPSFAPREHCFRLLPVLSGYRNQTDLTVAQTGSYIDVLEEAQTSGRQIKDLELVLPLDDVKVAHIFDVDVFSKHLSPAAPVVAPSAPEGAHSPPALPTPA